MPKKQDMEELEYYNNFEDNLQREMIKLCNSLGVMDNVLLNSEDIDIKWGDYADEYMADAIEQIKEYPEVAIAWAAYMGMAVAKWWDTDWKKKRNNNYRMFYGPHGFDDMDDYIVEKILGFPLSCAEARQIVGVTYSCAQMAINIIQKEQIEFGTPKAFYVFARTVKVMYRIGAAIELRRLGYKLEKMGLN